MTRMGHEGVTSRGGGVRRVVSTARARGSPARRPRRPRRIATASAHAVMIGRIVRPLDRYVFSEFWKIFVATALGFPLLVIVIDLTDHLRGVSRPQDSACADIALSYVYWIPDSMFMVLPAAVLFATVFSIGAFTRHAEVTAAKASGISFYRLIMPIFLGAVLAAGLDLALGELSPIDEPAAQRTAAGRQERQSGTTDSTSRSRASSAASTRSSQLRTDSGRIERVADRAKGSRARISDVPARRPTRRCTERTIARMPWMLAKGELSIVPDSGPTFTMSFAAARDKRFTERPLEMMAKSPDPHDMRYQEIYAIHQRDRAVGRRRQPVARRAGAEDRDAGHVHHHRAVRRAACHEHAARRRRRTASA